MMTHSNGERPGTDRAATGETTGSAEGMMPPPTFFILVMPLADFDNDEKAPFSLEKSFSARIVPYRRPLRRRCTEARPASSPSASSAGRRRALFGARLRGGRLGAGVVAGSAGEKGPPGRRARQPVFFSAGKGGAAQPCGGPLPSLPPWASIAPAESGSFPRVFRFFRVRLCGRAFNPVWSCSSIFIPMCSTPASPKRRK